MKKVIPIKFEKIWGYEIWIYSPVKGKETKFEDGTLTNGGPLIKIIKTTQPLSVQVHPDNKFAQEIENQANGKSESWYILDAQENATLVSGLITYDEKIIREKIANKTFAELLVHTPVKSGDFFNIPAGLIHGIGEGILLLEVQQPSDITYRYYDYDRQENGLPRELHIDKAIKVQKNLSYKLEPIYKEPLLYKTEIGFQLYMTKQMIIQKDSIVVDLENFQAYTALEGEKINFKKYCVISF